jgi:phosphoribosylanthranilate isomerase
VTPLRMKVCGVTRAEEVRELASLGVDYVGLWHGVRDGRSELPLARCRSLAGLARATGPEPVLVTFIADPKRLRDIAMSAAMPWLQLHGYQTPAVVRATRRGLPAGTRIIKALHLRDRECVEEPLIPAYERAGVDVFLLDAATPDGRLGSTGRLLDPRAVVALVDRLSRPFMLAGGLDARGWRTHAETVRHPRCLGIDVDTGTRAADGSIDPGKVRTIRNAWTACRAERVPG